MTAVRDPSGAFLNHWPTTCGDHRTVGAHRSWCFTCAEWCYPSMPCTGCAGAADDLAAGIAWTSVVDGDVAQLVGARDVYALDAAATDAFLLAARRRHGGADLRAHLFRVRSAYLARRLELHDLARARADAAETRVHGYASAPWAGTDPWAHAVPEPCL